MSDGIVDGLKAVSAVAAPVGIIVGAALAGWRAALGARLFPQVTPEQAQTIILRLAYLAWSASIVAMLTYAFVSTHVPEPPEPTRHPIRIEGGMHLPEGRSGWILAGRFEYKGGAPTSDVVVKAVRPVGASVGALAEYRDGAAIQIASPTRVRVINFVNVGWAGADVPPTTKQKGIEPGDETGVKLPVGAQMVIRGLASYRQGDLVVVWLRVADQPVMAQPVIAEPHPTERARYVWLIVAGLTLVLVALSAYVIGRGLRPR